MEFNARTIGIIATSSGSSNIHIKDVHLHSKDFDNDFDLPEPIQNYVGRDEQLNQLQNLLFEEDKTKVVICGIPGIGKSELAVQFADKCLNEGMIQKIYWIQAEQETELKKSWLSIKHIYGTSEKKKTLFILDNAISRKILSECKFQMPNKFFFIITSQMKDWGDDIVSIELSTLDLGSAVQFYREKLEGKYNIIDSELIELANFVGCLPLGLQITAAGVRQYGKFNSENCVQKYLKDLQTSKMNIIVQGLPSSTDNAYKNSIYKAIEISLNKIDAEIKKGLSPSITLIVLYMSSYLHPEARFYDEIECLLLAKNKNKNMLNNALVTLDNFSLATFRNRKIIIHRFIKMIIRYHFRTCYPDEEKEFFKMFLENLMLYDVSDSVSLILKSIFQHIDDITEPVVIEYFEKYRSKFLVPEIHKAFAFIINTLFLCGRTEIIKTIFDNAGPYAEVYIIKCNILQLAKDYDQPDIEELIQNYLDQKDSENTDNNLINIELIIEFYKYTLKDVFKEKYRASFEELGNLVGCDEIGLPMTAAGVREYEKVYGEKCIQKYLEDLKKSQTNILDEEFLSYFDNTYYKLYYGAIKLALDQIEAGTDPLKSSFIWDVLYFCSWVDRDSINFDNFKLLLSNTMKYVNSDGNMLEEALVTLDNFSLFTNEYWYMYISRLIRKILNHYRTNNSEKETDFVETCLENMLTHPDSLHRDLLSSVLTDIDTTIEPILTNFLEKHKSKLQNDGSVFLAFKSIFEILIENEHIEFIEKIFNTPGYCAKYYISEFDLLNYADECEEEDIKKLFQNYLDNNATDSENTKKNLKENPGTSLNRDSLELENEMRRNELHKKRKL